MTKKTNEYIDYSDDSNNDDNNAIKDKTLAGSEKTVKKTVILSTDVNDYDTGEAIRDRSGYNNENYSIFKAVESRTSRKNRNYKLGNKANLKTI